MTEYGKKIGILKKRVSSRRSIQFDNRVSYVIYRHALVEDQWPLVDMRGKLELSDRGFVERAVRLHRPVPDGSPPASVLARFDRHNRQYYSRK